MRPGIFPVPQRPRSVEPIQPTLGLWIRTRWSRRRLDRELSQGADPRASAERALRAQQLCSRSIRSQLAHALINTLDDARGPERFSIRPESQLAELRNCASDLLALAVRLQDGQPVEVRGAAMTALLATDGPSALDLHRSPDLSHAVRSARRALDPVTTPAQALPTAA